MRNQKEGSDDIIVAVKKLKYISLVSVDNKELQECKELLETIEEERLKKEELSATLNYINNEYAKYID